MSFAVMLQQLSGGMVRAIGIFLWTLIISLPLGLLVCKCRMSKIKIVQGIARVYIAILRGTPLMLQLLVWYFGAFYLFGIKPPERFVAVVIGFSLNYAAYFAEIYRSGINSIPVGQYEAAQILGYSKCQTFLKIILPQVFRVILPALTNEVITLVKDTSLAYAISYNEVFAITKQIAAAQTTFLPFIIAGVFYFVFNALVDFIMGKIEKKVNYYH